MDAEIVGIADGVRLDDLCRHCIPVVESVGRFIASQVGMVAADVIEEKSANSLVSYVDKEAEKQLVSALSLLLPKAGFLTEEATTVQRVGGEDWTWIIDPLDGTTNFLFGLPNFAISVALARREEVVLGIVYEVNRAEMFYAWKGGGAYCNGRSIHVRQSTVLEDTLVATGFPYSDFKKLPAQFGAVEQFQRSTRGVRRWGAAAIDLCFVACGRFDIFFENSLNPWDVAAGILLVQEAGGVVTDFQGTPADLSGREVVASYGSIHKLAVGVVRSWFYPESV